MSLAQTKLKNTELKKPDVDRLVRRAQFYEDSGNYKRAEQLLSKVIALGESDSELDRLLVAESLHDAGLLNICLDDLTKAKSLLQKSLAIRIELLGPEHPESLDTSDALRFTESEPLELIG